MNAFILNGRYGPSSCLCTTTGNSVVDYAISSIDLMPNIVLFNILDFCPLLSDIHSPLQIKIKNFNGIHTSDPNNTQHFTENKTTHKTKRWDGNKETNFIESIDRNRLNLVEAFLDDTETLEGPEVVDNVCIEIADIFDKAGKQVFGQRSIFKGKQYGKARIVAGKRMHKPYFNDQCRMIKKEFQIG